MKRHPEHETKNRKQLLFKTTPKKVGPAGKLSSKDEFLMTLMKLRLGLFVRNLSGGLCTQIFYS